MRITGPYISQPALQKPRASHADQHIAQAPASPAKRHHLAADIGFANDRRYRHGAIACIDGEGIVNVATVAKGVLQTGCILQRLTSALRQVRRHNMGSVTSQRDPAAPPAYRAARRGKWCFCPLKLAAGKLFQQWIGAENPGLPIAGGLSG